MQLGFTTAKNNSEDYHLGLLKFYVTIQESKMQILGIFCGSIIRPVKGQKSFVLCNTLTVLDDSCSSKKKKTVQKKKQTILNIIWKECKENLPIFLDPGFCFKKRWIGQIPTSSWPGWRIIVKKCTHKEFPEKGRKLIPVTWKGSLHFQEYWFHCC